MDILLTMHAPSLAGAALTTALSLASVAAIPGWADYPIDRPDYEIQLPLVYAGLLLLAAASTIFFIDNPLLIARCFG